MAREHPDYRANMEILNTRFPDHDMLSMEEAMTVTGWTDRRTLLKYMGKSFVNKRISKAALARYMCG